MPLTRHQLSDWLLQNIILCTLYYPIIENFPNQSLIKRQKWLIQNIPKITKDFNVLKFSNSKAYILAVFVAFLPKWRSLKKRMHLLFTENDQNQTQTKEAITRAQLITGHKEKTLIFHLKWHLIQLVCPNDDCTYP